MSQLLDYVNTLGATAAWGIDATDFTDEIGSNDLTTNGNPVARTPLGSGTGESSTLDGIGDFFVADSAALPTAADDDPYSVFCMFRLTDTGNNALWSQNAGGTPDNTDHALFVGSAGVLIVARADGTSLITGAIAVDDGLIHTAVVTRESGSTVRLYLDGVADVSTGTYAEIIRDTAFAIGSFYNITSPSEFNGDLLPTIVDNTVAWTAAQITRVELEARRHWPVLQDNALL